MKALLDSFWRAAAYCLHPRVVVLSLLPLVLAAGAVGVLGWFYWTPAADAVRGALESWPLVADFLAWVESMIGAGVRAVVAPVIVVALAVPAIVVLSLLLVAVLMTPALVNLVATRRFPQLQRRHGASIVLSVLWSLGCTLLALVALVVSIPLWFVPPLVLVLPPLIWGWLTYRVMSFDALADHADASERREVLREHRWPLLAIGVITGYLGAAPTLLWAFGAAALPFAPVLAVVSVWLYTLVFAFSALWFTHYTLAALQALRAAREPAPAAVPADVIELPPAPSSAAPPPPPAAPPPA